MEIVILKRTDNAMATEKNPQYMKLKTVQHELPQPRRRIMSSGNVSISCCTCDARCVTTIIYVK